MKSIIVLGAGGHSKVVIETILACNSGYKIVLLDDKFKLNKPIELLGHKILGPFEDIFKKDFRKKYCKAIVALGDSNLRIKWIKSLLQYGYDVPSFVHPDAYFSKSSKIGKGTVIFAKSVIQSEVKIGDGVIINSNSIIEHDGDIGYGTHICPGVTLGGNVKIGNSSWIGIGSTIIENLQIGSNVTIGAGSVVLNNLKNNSLAFGIPARIKK